MRQSVTWRPIILACALRRHNVFRCFSKVEAEVLSIS